MELILEETIFIAALVLGQSSSTMTIHGGLTRRGVGSNLVVFLFEGINFAGKGWRQALAVIDLQRPSTSHCRKMAV